MAINKVEALLKKVTRALDRAGVEYAVVGGNAVAAWVATVDEAAIRSTKDVDILVKRSSLGRIQEALRKLGFDFVEVLGVSMFVDRKDPSPKRGVHLIFANERIRPEYAHPAPDPKSAVRARRGFMVIDLPNLVKMKLQSYRLADRVHLIDLRSLDLLSASLIRRLPADLRKRLRQLETETN